MFVSDELKEALDRLENANIINAGRLITECLKVSANEEDVCSYMEKHAKYVSLEDELKNLLSKKQFPSDARVGIPFIYTLLYIFDTEKITLEDFVANSLYPKKDLDDGITLFSQNVAKSLKQLLEIADPNDEVLGTENDQNETNASGLYRFASKVSEILEKEDAEKIVRAVLAVETALKTANEDIIRTAYSALEREAFTVGLDDAYLIDVKDELYKYGVNV